jgi:small subunit ribosomal protein S24e
MDIEIVERKQNPLLEREEIRFEVAHEGEPTPTLVDIRRLLRAKVNSKDQLTVVDAVYSHFGSPVSSGSARIYKDEGRLKSTEARHILGKNFTPSKTEGKESAEGGSGETPASDEKQ